MNRVTFTIKFVELLNYMIAEGDHPIIDYVKRSTDEQQRLYLDQKSKCDGIIKVSKHQVAKAGDVYLINDDGTLHDWNADLRWRKYHDFWEANGGLRVIEWDKDHFEV